MPPNIQQKAHRVEQALAQGLLKVETLLAINLNAHLSQPRYWCKEELMTAIANYGIVDQMIHFIPRQKYRGEGGRDGCLEIGGPLQTGRNKFYARTKKTYTTSASEKHDYLQTT